MKNKFIVHSQKLDNAKGLVPLITRIYNYQLEDKLNSYSFMQ